MTTDRCPASPTSVQRLGKSGACILLVALAWLAALCWLPDAARAGIGAGELAEALTCCLPAPEDGWTAEPLIVDTSNTDLGSQAVSASRTYRQNGGPGFVTIKVYKSRWCCWLINFSGDLKKMSIKGKKAGLDEQKNDAIAYVRVKKHVVVAVEAHKVPQVGQAAERFASGIDYDKLEAAIFR